MPTIHKHIEYVTVSVGSQSHEFEAVVFFCIHPGTSQTWDSPAEEAYAEVLEVRIKDTGAYAPNDFLSEFVEVNVRQEDLFAAAGGLDD